MERTLLLDQGYQPMKLISWQNAVRLLTLGKVEILEEDDSKELRSPTWVIKMPLVARLLYAVKRKKKKVKFSRINVFARDKFTCQYCGVKKSAKNLTYDHVVPRKQGGKTTWTNIVACCSVCNRKKGGRTPKQAGMKLRNKPVQPKWMPAVVLPGKPDTYPSAWQNWLDHSYWHSELDE